MNTSCWVWAQEGTFNFRPAHPKSSWIGLLGGPPEKSLTSTYFRNPARTVPITPRSSRNPVKFRNTECKNNGRCDERPAHLSDRQTRLCMNRKAWRICVSFGEICGTKYCNTKIKRNRNVITCNGEMFCWTKRFFIWFYG